MSKEGYSWLKVLVVTVIGIALTDLPGRASWGDPPPLIGALKRPARENVVNRGDGPMCKASDPASTSDPILPDRMGVLLEETPTEDERAFVERALSACSNLRGPVHLVADPFQVLALLRLEDDLAIPDSARGILVAAWCIETSMKARPSNGKQFLGDWQDGVALASGSFQLHQNVWAKTCRGTEAAPHDLLWAASCWWSQVLKAADKARRVTGCRDPDMLRVGEAAASNVRRYGFRCKSKSAHWQMMELIQRQRMD